MHNRGDIQAFSSENESHHTNKSLPRIIFRKRYWLSTTECVVSLIGIISLLDTCNLSMRA